MDTDEFFYRQWVSENESQYELFLLTVDLIILD